MITSDSGRRVFALQIAGLKFRYHSNTPPISSNLDSTIASSINYVDSEGIIAVGAFGASVDPAGGIANYDALSVTLEISRRGNVEDPGVVFGRCGARSASTTARLTSSASRTSTLLNVASDLTSLSYPSLLHIGAETVRASSATSTTVTVSRGVGGTPQQNHSIELEGSIVPELTTEITTFRGRRAKLFMAHRYPNGTHSQYIEVLNGFIESSPIVESGDEVNLSIVPLTAIIDTDLSDKGFSQVRLLSNFHFFDGRYGSVLEYALSLEKDLDENEVTVTPQTVTSAATFSSSIVLGRNFNHMFDDFDVSLPKGPDVDSAPREHPRYPKLRRSQDAVFSDDGVYTSSVTFDASIPGYNITADSTVSSALSSAEITASESLKIRLPLVEIKQHGLGSSEVKRWPDVINDTLTSEGPSSTAGVQGGFARWRLNDDRSIRVQKLSNSPFPTSLYLWSSQFVWVTIRRALAERGVRAPMRWGAFGTSSELDSLSRLAYPIDLKTGDDPVIDDFSVNAPTAVLKLTASSSASPASYELRDLPTAYYQQYESAILVDGSLGLPTSAVPNVFHFITVQHYDHTTDDIRRQVFKVTHESTATFDGVNVGHLIHISDDNDFEENCSFGDWSGKERALIFRGGRLSGQRPGVALLTLLQSGGGDQVNGAYDLLSVGLSVNSADIDVDSFLEIDAASTFTLSDSFAGDGSNLRETFDSILKLLGAVMIMKRDEVTGRSRISLVALGNERSSSSAVTVNAEDWLADPPPYWSIYEDIVTQIQYEFDYDAGEDKYTSEVIFNNQEAINRYGGERSKISLRLPGVNSAQFGRGAGDNFSYFLPVSARIFNLLSNPLRLWRGVIGTGQSAFLDVGSYITVSSPHFKGYTDAYGVVDGVGMIKSIRQGLMDEGCELELITTGLAPVNWNSAAKVTSITSDTVTVSEDDFSSSTVDDVSFFRVGDVVDYVPLGNHDNAITGLTIASITNNTITFTAAHSISTLNGTLEPTTYANASALHHVDAYLANSSDKINTTVDAQEYS